MKKKIAIISLAALIVTILITGCGQEKAITAFVGSASKPPIEEAASAFEQKTGIKVYLNFGGSGTVLSQMQLSRTGDLYIPGSPDYIIITERAGIIEPGSEKIIAYLVPAILVQHGNPRNIKSLSDLARPGIKVGIGNPEAVCVGLYAIEILDYNNVLETVAKNIVTYAESCDKTASLIALKSVDAIIGWDVFAKWNPDTTDAVFLESKQIPRLAYIPGAISRFTQDRENARKFLDFLASPEGQKFFSKYGYITTEVEARKLAPEAKIGGEYQLPDTYKALVK